MIYTVQMIMTHLTVDRSIVLTDTMVAQALTMEGASNAKYDAQRVSTAPGTAISDLRQMIYRLNPNAGSVRTKFVIRANP